MEANVQEEEEEVQNKKQEQRRLSDFLLESDDELFMEANFENKKFLKSSQVLDSDVSSSGRRIRFPWFGRKTNRKEKIEEVSQKNLVPSVPKPDNDTSLSLGMGIGLFLLLAKTNYECNKLSELHEQMKVLLREIRNEFENKIVSSTSLDLNCNLRKNHEEMKSEIMDDIEAELETELERMRLDFSEESSSVILEEKINQMPNEWIDLCENLGINFERNDETGDDESNPNYEVSPHELERKLQALLHQRQQERIKELESQLQNLERKLLVKEFAGL